MLEVCGVDSVLPVTTSIIQGEMELPYLSVLV